MSGPDIDWRTVLRYDVETAGRMNPPTFYVERVLVFRQQASHTRLLGPFTGGLAGAAARTIANSLNSFTVGMGEEWDRLTPDEQAYITHGLTLPERPGLDDDDIPF